MTREEAIEMWVIPALENTWNEKRCNEVLEALGQEPCTDAISRQAYDKGFDDGLEEGLKVGACGDCIDRQDAIDLADELKDDLPDDDRLSDMVMSHNEGILEYQTKLSLLPPVTPTEKVGQWIMHIDDLFPAESTMECNKCHEHQPITIDDNYCPNCGQRCRRWNNSLKRRLCEECMHFLMKYKN